MINYKHCLMGALALILTLCVLAVPALSSDEMSQNGPVLADGNHIDTSAPTSATVGKLYSYTPTGKLWGDLSDSYLGAGGGYELYILGADWLSDNGRLGDSSPLVISGTPTSTGTYNVTVGFWKTSDHSQRSADSISWTINVSSAPPVYTVSFNANGGSYTPPSQQVESGKSLKLPANAGTKSGYSFGGWTTGTSTVAGGTTIVVRQDLHYTAIWNERVSTYEVVFYYDDYSTEYATVYVNQNTAIGSKLPEPISKPGYTFNGWAMAHNGDPVTSSTIITRDMSVFPDMVPGKYTAVFDTNGGGTNTVKTVTFSEDYGTLPTPTRDGYTFAGWFTEREGGTQITASTKVTTPGHHIIYAHWNAVTHTVSFNSNGGSGSISSLTGSATSPVILPSAGFTKTNHVLKGWNTSADGSGTHYDLGSSISPTANITLYAEWEASNLIVNYKTISGETIKEGSLTAESSTDLVKSLLESSDDIAWIKFFDADYGYYLDQNKTERMSDTLTVGEISSTDVIYVIVTTYVYNLYDGDTLVKTWNDYWAEADIYIILAREIEAREGYTLHFRDSAGNTYQDDGSMPSIKHDENFYTVWTPIQYTVAFESNGGSSVAAQTVNHNSIPAKPEEPTKSGFVFGGWYIDIGLVTEYTFTKGITSNQTLYAKWYEEIIFDSVPKITDIIVSIDERTIKASLAVDNYDYILWDAGDGSELIKTYGTKLEYTYGEAGNYDLKVTAVNNAGDSEQVTYNVTVDNNNYENENNVNNSNYHLLFALLLLGCAAAVAIWMVKK